MEKNVVGKESKDNLYPVFKADIMDERGDAIEAPAAVPPLSPETVAPVSGAVPAVDGLALWRAMSERYRDQRLAREAAAAQPAADPLPPSFQDEYEQDCLSLTAPRPENYRPQLVAMLRQVRRLAESPAAPPGDLPRDRAMDIGQVMSRPVLTILASTPIEQAAALMIKKHISGLPVVRYQDRHLIGLITLSDILDHLLQEQAVSSFQTEGAFFEQKALAILDQPVRRFMQTQLVEAPPDCPLPQACALMSRHRVHRLLVTRDHRILGIFTSLDAARVLAQLTRNNFLQ